MEIKGSLPDHLILENQRVEKIVPGGSGLVRNGSEVIFVPEVLPGEIINLEITDRKKKFSRGICRSIIKQSEIRIEPPCPLFEECGGCNLQHMSYDHQIELKTQLAKELFQRFARIDLPEDFYFVQSPAFSYRQRIQIHSNGIHLGFKAKRGDRIVPVKDCPILIPSLNQYLKDQSPSSFFGRKTLFGLEDHVYTEDDSQEFALSIDKHDFYLKGSLFFQSNARILSDMVRFALEGQNGDTAMDLYCGVGLFSVFLKNKFRRIVAIEINPETESFYRKNMQKGEYDYYAMSLENWLKKGFYRKSGKIDLIVVDPPRTGLSKSVRQFLVERPVSQLVYISCDPATQARDTEELLKNGYKITTMRGFDFYPQTNHMETVIRFSR